MKRSSEQTERYLQAVFEIAEDGERATRAGIARRMQRSPATIAQASARLVRAGLIRVCSGRRVQLTAPGEAMASATVRKHRLVECFLHDVVGLEWVLVHSEAARWQHVVSDHVAARIARMLGGPARSPYGCAVPGAEALRRAGPPGAEALSDIAVRGRTGVVDRVSERLQATPGVLDGLYRAGVVPGMTIRVCGRVASGPVTVCTRTGGRTDLAPIVASGIRVRL